MEQNSSFKQVLKFTLFSISAGIIQIASFAILNELIPIFNGDYGINYIISLLLSIIWNFTFNRKFTFKATNDVKKAMLLVLLFYIVFTPISAIMGNYFEKNGANEYIVLALAMITNFVLEFLYTKFVVYRDENEPK
ncbi:GtrA family protein [Haploplasma axanthum]|nr:GtrA family protein [Haploplasma axanthum]